MKKYILIALVFIGTTVAAQNTNQPKLESKGTLTVATYFYDNGSVPVSYTHLTLPTICSV